MIWRIIFTIVFGLVWWICFIFVGPNLTYLMILGSVLAVCACCCKGGEPPNLFHFNFSHYVACILRCLPATLTLIIGLFVLGVIVAFVTGGMAAVLASLVQILFAAIGAPLFVRLICCAYES